VDTLGDPLPAGAVARLGTTRFNHRGGQFLGFTADRKAMLFLTDGSLLSLDAGTGRLTRKVELGDEFAGPYRGRPRRVSPMLALSADGKTAALGTTAGDALVLVDADTGKPRQTFDENELFRGNSRKGPPGYNGQVTLLSSDGKLLVLAHTLDDGPAVVHVLAIADKKQVYQIRSGKDSVFGAVALDATGTVLLLVEVTKEGKATVRLRDLAADKELASFGVPVTHLDRVQLLADGKQLFAVEPKGDTVRLFDVPTGKETLKYKAGAGAERFAVTPDGKSLFLADAGMISQVDTASGMEVRQWKAPSLFPGERLRLAVTPAGDKLVLIASQRVTCWDLASGKELSANGGHQAGVWSVAFSADGTELLTAASDTTAAVWNVKSSKLERRYTPAEGPAPVEPQRRMEFGRAIHAGFSGSGKYVAAVWDGDVVHVWDRATGKLLRTLTEEPVGDDVVLLACSPRGDLAAIAGMDGRVRLVDLANGKQLRKFLWHKAGTSGGGKADGLFAVAFSPDGGTLAVGGLVIVDRGDNAQIVAKLFETATNRERLAVDVGGKLPSAFGEMAVLLLLDRLVLSMSFSGDGQTLVLGTLQGAQLRDAFSGKEKRVFTSPNVYGKTVTLSPNGKLLAAGTLDGGLRLWRTDTGEPVAEVAGHDYAVTSVAFAPDGKTLATASEDSTVLVWSVDELLQGDKQEPKQLPKDLNKLWELLASDDAMAAFKAMGAMARMPKETAAFLKDKLKPVPPADPKVLEQLITDLNSPTYAVRQKATAELEKMADLAGQALRDQLKGKPSLEMRKRIEALLDKLDGPVTQPELLRSLRTVELLELIGTPESRAVLEPITKGAPGHRLTEAAQDSVKRLEARKKALEKQPEKAPEGK
jgi:WD40 repeat protein